MNDKIDFSSTEFWADNYVLRRSVGQALLESLVEIHKPTLASEALVALFDEQYKTYSKTVEQ